jgi:hypothetical protein
MSTEEMINKILETHVISYLDKDFLLGLIEIEGYGNENEELDTPQIHFTGKTLTEVLQNAVNFLT